MIVIVQLAAQGMKRKQERPYAVGWRALLQRNQKNQRCALNVRLCAAAQPESSGA